MALGRQTSQADPSLCHWVALNSCGLLSWGAPAAAPPTGGVGEVRQPPFQGGQVHTCELAGPQTSPGLPAEGGVGRSHRSGGYGFQLRLWFLLLKVKRRKNLALSP